MSNKITLIDRPNNTNEQENSTSFLMKDAFGKWLANGNAKKFSTRVILDCLDKICDYVERKKISCGLWKISSPSIFKPVYQQVLDAKLLRIMEWNTYKVFIVAGKLYMKYLKEKPWIADIQIKREVPSTDNTIPTNNEVKIGLYDRQQLQQLSESDYSFSDQTRKITVKFALIEFSNNYKGEIKSSKEIVEEISTKYGHNVYSVLPADYEISLNNDLPKLFKRVDHGVYICLGSGCDISISDFPLSIDANIFQHCDAIDRENTMKIISIRFKNGFRKSSTIDFERFKNFYIEEFGTEFPHDAYWLSQLLLMEALLYDDRAYVYDENVISTVLYYLEQMDSPCIFIDVFFNKHNNEFYDFSIFSTEMLRAFIEKNYSNISVKYGYVLLEENTTPADLIRSVFGERETWSINELQERLPCIKNETICQLMNTSEYFRVDKGVYTHINNMDLPDSEGEKIAHYIESKLILKDYVIANELDLSVFVDLNPHCSFLAVRDAVFYKFLSEKYEKCGQIITPIGVKLRVVNILEQYCREAITVTFEELNELEATFDPEGRSHSQCLIAGHNVMVRVSAELFVSDSKVNFDVERIDEAISLYCQGDFIPLREILDFSLFPYAGYTWNLFLLESYVRRFSRIFKYDVRAVNSGNIGVIVKESYSYNDYDDILAAALAKASVALDDKKAIGSYLFDAGYIGWRNLGKNENKIIKNAMALREGGKV